MKIELELDDRELFSLIHALMEYRRENERKSYRSRNKTYHATEFYYSDLVLNKVFAWERKHGSQTQTP